LCQRLSELGNKPQSPFSSASYLKGNLWRNGILY
jgi:hypothetical protein